MDGRDNPGPNRCHRSLILRTSEMSALSAASVSVRAAAPVATVAQKSMKAR